MSDLTDFLQARIAEDEHTAAIANPCVWQFAEDQELGGIGNIIGTGDTENFHIAYDNDRENGYGAVDIENATHIVRWQPSRVLAECEAKRRIVAEHGTDKWDCHVCTDEETFDEDIDGNRTWSRSAKQMPCPTLRFLALPYADHEDFQEEWRP